MRILVLSDTHGGIIDTYLEKINADDAFDMFIHCGDCCKDVPAISEAINVKEYINVSGNCDRGTGIADIEQVTLEGKKIIVTHGHNFEVKHYMDELKEYAESHGADIVLFGHTHEAYSKYENGILYFNPGSACIPTYGKFSYGIITVKDKEVCDEIVEW